MKVLLLDVNCGVGSTGKLIYRLYENLNYSGEKALIGYGRGNSVREKDIYKFAPKWEVYLHALLTRLTGYTGCFSPIATKRLLGFMDEINPDVVHLNDMHGYFVNIIPLIEYLKKRKIKTIWTFHCEFMYTGKCGHAYECNKWQTCCEKCPALNDYPQSFFFDRTHAMFLKKKKAFEDFDNLIIVTPSQWLADRVKQSFLGKKQIEVVFNCVNTQIFHIRESDYLRVRYGISNETKVILSVAPDIMSKRKGGLYIVKTAEHLQDLNVVFLLVGVSAPSGRKQSNVIEIGHIQNQEELAAFYSLADIFVLCSKRETFSMTTAEALCCGTLVAGFRAGAPETIALEKYSEFVENGNILELENAIRRKLEESVISDKSLIEKEAKALYSDHIMFNSYLKLYKR